jgi:hypothetical protein
MYFATLNRVRWDEPLLALRCSRSQKGQITFVRGNSTKICFRTGGNAGICDRASEPRSILLLSWPDPFTLSFPASSFRLFFVSLYVKFTVPDLTRSDLCRAILQVPTLD